MLIQVHFMKPGELYYGVKFNIPKMGINVSIFGINICKIDEKDELTKNYW
jgi:hypothetical protein